MTVTARRPARYADLEALPDDVVGQIIDGDLIVSPRPAVPHTVLASNLGADLNTRFRPRRGGPSGGWWILDEPEILLGENVIVPDIAGWRVEKLPELPVATGIAVAPDWVCEVLSPSTQRIDRVKKMRIYARAQVGHAWLIDPAAHSFEAYALVEDRWVVALVASDDEKVRAPPFEELEIQLDSLWI